MIRQANGGGGQAIFALRNDLGPPRTSEPFVIMKYREPQTLWPKLKLYKAVVGPLQYAGTAGTLIQPPYPLTTLSKCVESHGHSGPYWRDRKLDFWAKAAGNDGGDANVAMRYYYTVQDGFYFPGANPPGGARMCRGWI